MIHPSAQVDPSAIIGPNVVIGEHCIIGPGTRILNSTVMAKTTIKGYCYIEGTIIGWSNTIGMWTRIEGLTVTSEDVTFRDELFVHGIIVLPHKSITTNQSNPGTIIM